MASQPRFDEVLEMVRQLTPEEKRRLIELVEPDVETDEGTEYQTDQSESLLGLWEDLGPAPSAEEIDEARREAWKNFPREDI